MSSNTTQIHLEAIIVRCDPRCVRFEKKEKRDNQVRLNYYFPNIILQSRVCATESSNSRCSWAMTVKQQLCLMKRELRLQLKGTHIFWGRTWKWHILCHKLLLRWVATIQFLLETFFVWQFLLQRLHDQDGRGAWMWWVLVPCSSGQLKSWQTRQGPSRPAACRQGGVRHQQRGYRLRSNQSRPVAPGGYHDGQLHAVIQNWLMVQADLLSIQLLHDAGDEGLSDGTYSGEVFSVPLLIVLDPVGSTVRYEMMKLCSGSV